MLNTPALVFAIPDRVLPLFATKSSHCSSRSRMTSTKPDSAYLIPQSHRYSREPSISSTAPGSQSVYQHYWHHQLGYDRSAIAGSSVGSKVDDSSFSYCYQDWIRLGRTHDRTRVARAKTPESLRASFFGGRKNVHVVDGYHSTSRQARVLPWRIYEFWTLAKVKKKSEPKPAVPLKELIRTRKGLSTLPLLSFTVNISAKGGIRNAYDDLITRMEKERYIIFFVEDYGVVS